MAGQQPFLNSSGLNFFPLFGNPLGNSQQLLNQLNALRMPQPNINQESHSEESSRSQRMHFNEYYDRVPLESHGEEMFREPFYRLKHGQSEDERSKAVEKRDKIHGLMDRYISPDFLFPEMSPDMYSERQMGNESNRRNYGASATRQTPIRLPSQSNHREGKYGARNDAAVPWNAVLRRNCYLVPPLDDTYVLQLSEKQPGCHTVFINGLPKMADEDIIMEIFSVCGPIEKITVNNGRAKSQVKHCQVQFVEHSSAEKAVKFNGHVLVIGDGCDRKTKIGRIRVDYSKLPVDNKETDIKIVNKQPYSQDEEKHVSIVYSRKEVFHLLDLIRHDQAIIESLDVLTHWFEKGECNRSTVNVFHTVLSTIHTLIKRLINRRKEHEQLVEMQKQQALERAKEIKKQYEAVWKVFEVATKQKSWDHFTKAQRKNITQWQSAIKNEIKSAKEAEIQNRVEVGMDLDDEVSGLAGLIEQPALQMAEKEQKEEKDQATISPSKPKKRRVDASESDTDSALALKLENEKLRTQVESLKAIAEQNTSLMWSMQSYQNQAEQIRQQYTYLVAQKDYEIFQLKNALQGANILSDPQRAMSELEIVVDMSKDNPGMKDMDLETDEEVRANNERPIKGEDTKKEETKNDEKSINNGSEDVMKENSGHLTGGQNGGEQHTDTRSGDFISSSSQAGRDVTPEESDLCRESGSINSENRIIEIGKSGIEDKTDKVEEKDTSIKREKIEESRAADTTDTQAEEERKEEENEEEEGNGGKQAQGEEIEPDEKEVNEDSAEEGEEGSGRFVRIDDEQFEVIDDMDEEDSDDGYREVTVPSPRRELHTVSEQFLTESSFNGPEDNAQKKTENSEDDYKEVTTHTVMSKNDDQLNDQLAADSLYYESDYTAQYQAWLSTAAPSYTSQDHGPAKVRISGEELVLVGIICSYLQLCPSGATSGEIRDYLSRQFKERRKEVLERLLNSLPVLFKAYDASGNAKWKFCGFENLEEFKGET